MIVKLVIAILIIILTEIIKIIIMAIKIIIVIKITIMKITIVLKLMKIVVQSHNRKTYICKNYGNAQQEV